LKHSSSAALYAYWDERRGSRAAPERSDIEPGAIRTALGDSFILSLDGPGGLPVRLAGTRVCSLFGRELKGEPFENLWTPRDRTDFRELTQIVADESVVILGGASGLTEEGDTVDLEILLLPLRHHGRTHARQIGVIAPLKVPFWLGATPVVGLKLISFRHIAAEVGTLPAPLEPIAGGRRKHGLVVYDGGRT
jgi:hypothetical protein